MAAEHNRELLEIVMNYLNNEEFKQEEIEKSFSVVPTLHLATKRGKMGETVDFVFHLNDVAEPAPFFMSGKRLARVSVNFYQETIKFQSLPNSEYNLSREAMKIALLRALASVKPTPKGTYHDTPSLREAPPYPYIATIPLDDTYSISGTVEEYYSSSDDSLSVSYKKLDVDNNSAELNVKEGRKTLHVKVNEETSTKELQVSCDCNEFQQHEGRHLCPHIREAINSIYYTLCDRYFNPEYTSEVIIQDTIDCCPPEHPIHYASKIELKHTKKGKFQLSISSQAHIPNPSDTLGHLGLTEDLLQTHELSDDQRKNDRNLLFFYIEPFGAKLYSDVSFCTTPEPARGKIGKSGRLNLTFSSLDLDKLSQQISLLTREESVDATEFLGKFNESTSYYSYFNHDPSPLANAKMHKVAPILFRHPIYLYVDKFKMDTPPYNRMERLTPLTLHSEQAEATLHLLKHPKDASLIHLKIALQAGDQVLEVKPDNTLLNEAFMLLNYSDLYIFRSAGDYQLAHQLLQEQLGERPLTLYHIDDLPQLYDTVIKPLGKHFEVTSEVHPKQPISDEHTTPQLFLTDTKEGDVRFTPAMQYGDDSIPLTDRAPLYDHESGTLLLRDSDKESQYLDYLRSLHPTFDRNMTQFTLTAEELIEENWLLTTSEKLRQRGVQIFGAEKLQNFRFNLHTPTISISTSRGIDWFDLKIDVAFGKQKVPLRELRKSVMNRSQYVPLSDGTLGILPEEWLERYAKYFKVGRLQKDKLEISNYQFNVIDQLSEDLQTQPKYIKEMMERRQRLQNLSHITPHPIPKGIQAELRNYQKSGFEWLLFLRENQLGGCLADDMGLGKTLQVITLLQHIKESGQSTPPHLIVLPTSLLFNWQKELQKFAPNLTYMVYRGNDRATQRESFGEYDIILSTYGVVANDIEQLTEQTFEYVILDESQAIKNPFSKRYKAVRLLTAKHRLALTGTPIENNTFDLYAQLNFLNPGIFGSMDHFRQNFANAIDRDRDEQTTHLLREMTKPFILRRTKKQVATELPDKTESILYCEMKEEQRQVYESHRDQFRTQLLGAMEESGEGETQMMVLQALTKLRQICNSPALISTETEDYGEQSIKLDLLIRNLRDIVGEHKVLVFSQFTSMLALVKKRLQLEGISYLYLDGATTNREEIVTQFQEDDEVRVFLISLKAGGTGLNLTAADYVFLIDPWWNPAVENQAIDRAYRIGQEKHVNAYRMVCKDTIEEKIIELQSSKRSLSEDIIQTDNIQKSFSRDDIATLFK